jgi:hypothetical protein
MTKKTRKTRTCKRCGCEVSDGIACAKGHDYVPKGFCRDGTCPFSDHLQSCKAGWNGHPKMDPNPTDDDAQMPCTCGGKKEIEMYVGYCSHTWDTEVIDIPGDTPEDKIESVAVAAMTAKLNAENVETAFIGVYHISE